jgi:hypothetical protein
MPYTSILLSTAYLAPIEYYAVLVSPIDIILDYNEYFVKQSFRNRCEIRNANGKLSLSIPLSERKNKSITKDIRVSNIVPWQTQHWRAIESAYSRSPYFEFYQDDLQPIYSKKINYLMDFNFMLQEKILELLGIKQNITIAKSYIETQADSFDARNKFTPKKVSSIQFEEYIQVFENKFPFYPNLSILDLLFNMGNEAKEYLHNINLSAEFFDQKIS